MQLSVVMDPTNPRWQTSEERTNRRATTWKIIASAVAASALTTVVVASCLGRDVAAQRDADEPAYVETTSATRTTTPVTPAPATTSDSSGGIAPVGASTITSASMPAPVHTERNYSPMPVPFERAYGDSSTSGTDGTIDGPNAGHASHANNDPNNRPAPDYPFETEPTMPAP